MVQSGEYESNILSAQCDNQILGELERYVNRFLFHEKPDDPAWNRILRKNGRSGPYKKVEGPAALYFPDR